jgi:hypothetical protein
MKNIERYKKDIAKLLNDWTWILYDLVFSSNSLTREELDTLDKDQINQIEKLRKQRIPFKENYQTWYSESLTLVKQILPDRLNDFIKLYEKPKTTRKDITHENYVIEDALQGLTITRWWFEKKIIVWVAGAIPRIEQQIAIIKSCEKRFESSLFEIKQLLQADLFDSEVSAAKDLAKKWFLRAAGAVVGVVLEWHLEQICINHALLIQKKNSSINDLNELLKKEDIIDISVFRKIQFLWDIRNKCDHKKTTEPTKEEIESLCMGVDQIIKTIY